MAARTGLISNGRMPIVIWLFPLAALIGVAAVWFAGGSAVTEDFVRDQLAATYGLSKTQLERLSLQLPGGWPHSSYDNLESPPHDHPWPDSFSVPEAGLALIFPHIGDGLVQDTDLSFQTTIQLVDSSTISGGSSGRIEFYDDEGNPLVVTVESVTDSIIPFDLANGESKRFTTSGTGVLKTGWAHVHSDQPIGGASSFGIRDPAGSLLTDVGVAPSSPGTEFTIFADSIGESQTGVAASNPSDTEPVTLGI